MPAGTGTDAVQAARVMVDAFRLSATQNDATGILSGILDGLAELVRLDAAGVYIVDTAGRKLRHSLVRGCDLPVPQIKAPFDGQGAIGTVLATGRPVRLTADSREVSEGRGCARSRLLVPILGATGGVLGALDVWSDDPEGYDSEAAHLLTTYGLAVAGAIEGARLQAEMVDKRRMDVDLALARQVMQELLPNNTPDLPGFDIAGRHASSLAVGGDYYEFISLGDDRWGVVIADVVGKGMTAALLVSAIRASIASLVGHELAVRAIMRRANRFFHESVAEGKYVTLFYAVLDVQHRRLLYSNAGHVPPVLLRKGGGVELLDDGGVPLGLFKAPRYVDGYATLHQGDLLALYTDGVVEAMDRDEEPYGLDRFVAMLAHGRDSSACEICSTVMRDVRQHVAGSPTDDCSLVVIKAN